MHALCTLRTHFCEKKKRDRERVDSYLAAFIQLTYSDKLSPGLSALLKGTMVKATFFKGIKPVTLFTGPDI